MSTSLDAVTTALAEAIAERVVAKLRAPVEDKPQSPNLTAAEAARYLRISRSTLSAHVTSGRIKAVRLAGRVLFRREDLDAALNCEQR